MTAAGQAPDRGDGETFDIIIVGAGSAGCVLANRLSADGTRKVLLLEAGGPDRKMWLHIPAGYFKTIHDPELGWGYATEPQPNLDGRSLPWPRGRTLGGTSAINGLIYIRGQPEDYDHWRQLGNVGWAWDDVLPYFRKSEGQAAGNQPLDPDVHGSDGPLSVSDFRGENPLCEAMVTAATEIGIPYSADFNCGRQDGAGYYQITTRNGRRASAAAAYLKPALTRPNLKVVTHALVTRIGFDGRRAAAVHYRVDGVEKRADSRGEIVLSGGSINSPQLLQLSGIGDATHLKENGIEPVHHAPEVGRNLQDHLQAQLVCRSRQPVTINDALQSPLRKAGILWQYLTKRSGPLASAPSPVGGFYRSREEAATADLQFFMMPLSVARPGVLDTNSGYTFCVNQSRPESRGEIMITSPDPAAKPAIRPNYLEAERDREAIVAGLKLLRRIANAPAFAPFRAGEVRPGDDVRTDDELLDYARRTAGTMYHPVGTCRMGADDRAVVDTSLRVRGIDGLRVVDASVMPTLVSGNTNAPTIMIAEKAADLMLKQGREKLAA